MKYIALFHNPCQDGIASAWVFQTWCNSKREKFKLLPADYASQSKFDIKQFKDKVVYFLDYTLSVQETLDICKVAKRVIILDHHKTAQEKFKGVVEKNLTIYFNMDKCGCTMAWEYFFPRQIMPRMLEYIEDYDLGHFSFAMIGDFMAWFESYNCYTDVNKFALAQCAFSSNINGCLKIGSELEKYKTALIDSLINNAEEVVLNGVAVVKINCPIIQFNTFLGRRLVEKYNKPAWIWYRKNSIQNNSLRSRDDLVDVGALAKELGGGGHRNASGFVGEV